MTVRKLLSVLLLKEGKKSQIKYGDAYEFFRILTEDMAKEALEGKADILSTISAETQKKIMKLKAKAEKAAAKAKKKGKG